MSLSRHLTAYKALLALAFGLPLLVYLLTLAPGLTWAHHGADGGDLVTAAHSLGVPHPPGYPTYTLLAWLFTRLPLGSVAWRINLLSAISSAATAALIYWIVTHNDDTAPDTPTCIAGLGAAWSYAFAPLVWSQALIAEVYAPAGLWTAAILGLALLLSRKHKSASVAFTLGLTWGLGLGIHLTLILLAPLVAWAIWQTRRLAPPPFRFAPEGGIGIASLGLLTGLLTWLYLPLRAGRGSVTWGQPTTLSGFWWLVSGTLYRDYLFSLPISALGGRLAAWAQTWLNGLGPSGIGLATWAVLGSSNRRRGWLVVSGLCFIAYNLYALGYDTADSVVYLASAFVIASVWLGIGLTELLRQLPKRGQKRHWLTAMLPIIALAMPAWSLAHNWTALDLSDDHEVRRFCQAVTQDAPSRSILFSTTDRQTFALWYCQKVEGLRPDLTIVDEGLIEFEWYRAGLQRTWPDLWISQADATTAPTVHNRPRCLIHRENQTGWLDCQD